MTDMTLQDAIAEVRRVTGGAVGWDGWDFYSGGIDNDEPTYFNWAEATILNAVASGDLIPKTDLAATEAQVGALTSLLERAVMRVPPAFHSLRAEIRAALASAQGVKHD